jgi:hypothetical protein
VRLFRGRGGGAEDDDFDERVNVAWKITIEQLLVSIRVRSLWRRHDRCCCFVERAPACPKCVCCGVAVHVQVTAICLIKQFVGLMQPQLRSSLSGLRGA